MKDAELLLSLYKNKQAEEKPSKIALLIFNA
jgi:hypothetical protein